MASSYHRLFRTGMLTLLCSLLASFAIAGAGDNQDMLSKRIAAAIASGTAFRETTLFAASSGLKHTAVLGKETLLHPLTAEINALFAERPTAIAMNLKTDEGGVYRLEMLQSQPISAALTTGVIDAGGRHQASYTGGVHYQGHLAGVAHSMASMSVFANGEVMILFANDAGNFVVGKLTDGSGNYTFYNDKEMLQKPEMPCAVDDLADKPVITNTGSKGTRALMCNKVRLYWEISYNVFTSKGSNLTTTQNYVTGLFNQVQTIYANENIGVELKSFYIWTTQDDYPTTSSSLALNKFRGYWSTMGNSYDGDLAHLLTRDNSGNGGGNGGLAYVDVLCGGNFSYAYSDIYGVFQTVPTYSWDAMVVSHETGHNMGSKHTHWCGWNTGANGTCGSIDNCTTQEAEGNCTTCPSTFLNSAATNAWRGTIMSYCHLVSRGISLANGFGPLPGDVIRTNVATSGCLASIINATLDPAPICNNVGSILVSYPPNNLGTAPFAYAWNNNATTRDLNGIQGTGSYTVAITDSNGCQATFSTTVKTGVAAGNGMAITESMPVCCQNTTRQITVKAGVPSGLTSGCETVYWLKTGAAIASLSQLQAIFDTTQAANILVSTNNSSINGSTGAQLKINPPISCTAPVTVYYTPIVVRLPRAADSIINTVAASSNVMNGSVQLGNRVTLPDLSASPSACVLGDTPSRQSLAINVTAYTGRANNMRIVVSDANGEILYQKFGLSGIGTYNIDPAIFKGNILQGMTIAVLDFNCASTTASTCTSSQATVNAVRRVVYDALPLRLAPACALSTPVRVDFAPDNCTHLIVSSAARAGNAAIIHPNPASHIATLQYNTSSSGKVQLKVSDVAGRSVFSQENYLPAGNHKLELDVHAWAKGLYLIMLTTGDEQPQSMKLAVQ